MDSALLSGLPLDMLKELALHALQGKQVTVDEAVDELIKFALRLRVFQKLREPWRSIALRVERPLLEFVIRGIVDVAEAELVAAGVLPAPAT